MNRLASFGFVPTIAPTIKFVGGPWDGMYARWFGGALPEYLETNHAKLPGQVPHVYQLWVFTDTKGVTHTIYKHRGQQKNET